MNNTQRNATGGKPCGAEPCPGCVRLSPRSHIWCREARDGRRVYGGGL